MRPRAVGVVVDPARVLPWQRAAIGLLEKEDVAVSVHSVPGRAAPPPMARLTRRILDWEWRRSGRGPHPLDRVRLASPPRPLASAPDVDVLVWLADAEIPPELARRTPLGVWYVTQGEARAERDCPLLREVVSGTGLVETALWSFDGERHSLLVLAKGIANRFSYLEALSRASAKAAALPARVVRWGGARPLEEAERAAAAPGPPRLPALRLVARLGIRTALRRVRRRLFEERWMVAWRPAAGDGGPPAGHVRYRLVESGEGHYYADPFPVVRDGGTWLFFEDFSYATGRGSIVAAAMDARGPRQAQPVLDLETHLSYPFVFEDGGEAYMLPENRRSNSLELWRATSFPEAWERAWPLLQETAVVDATLLRHDGRFWLFAALALDEGAPVDELSLFHSEDLRGPWIAHPLNPVVSDVRRARPAGPILIAGDALIRPSQDCSRAYGWRTVFNRIEVLTAEDYHETPVAVATPAGWRARRTHTFARAGGIEAVDVLVSRPRLPRGARIGRSRLVGMRFTPL